eukprot:1068838-Rhodomonas_salina.4
MVLQSEEEEEEEREVVCISLAYAAIIPVLTWRMLLSVDTGTDLLYTGDDLGYTATRLLSAYARAMQLPVLTWRMG